MHIAHFERHYLSFDLYMFIFIDISMILYLLSLRSIHKTHTKDQHLGNKHFFWFASLHFCALYIQFVFAILFLHLQLFSLLNYIHDFNSKTIIIITSVF